MVSSMWRSLSLSGGTTFNGCCVIFLFCLLQGMVVNGFVNVAITISLTFDGCCMIFLFCFVTGEGSEWFCQCGNLYH